MSQSLATTRPLSHGKPIPIVGLGTYLIKGPDAEAATRDAIAVGYRHIDTAWFYRNETEIGRAIQAFGNRDELFITTKLWNTQHDRVREAADDSRSQLGIDVIDLYLVHWPCGIDVMPVWREMEKLLEAGVTRAIGVSNFAIPHLQTLLEQADVAPAVNQVEFHPRLVQSELHAFEREHGIVGEAYSPLMHGNFTDIGLLETLADEVERHPTQVLLRWNLQHGIVTIPKSANRAHIESNAAIFDFELSDDQMARLDACDEHHRYNPDPMVFDVKP